MMLQVTAATQVVVQREQGASYTWGLPVVSASCAKLDTGQWDNKQARVTEDPPYSSTVTVPTRGAQLAQ